MGVCNAWREGRGGEKEERETKKKIGEEISTLSQRELVTAGHNWRTSPRTERTGGGLLMASAPEGVNRIGSINSSHRQRASITLGIGKKAEAASAQPEIRIKISEK